MKVSQAGGFLVATIVAMVILALPARAAEKGDLILRVRGVYVVADESSDITVVGGSVDADTDIVPEIDLTYFLTDNLALELMAATTEHRITASGIGAGVDLDLGDVRLLPPTLTLQYHADVTETIRAYVGAGLNYTVFYDANLPSGGAITRIDYDDTVGWVLQAGVDYQFHENWVFNMDVKKVFLQTDVDLNGGAIEADVDLDPWIFGVGFGYCF